MITPECKVWLPLSWSHFVGLIKPKPLISFGISPNAIRILYNLKLSKFKVTYFRCFWWSRVVTSRRNVVRLPSRHVVLRHVVWRNFTWSVMSRVRGVWWRVPYYNLKIGLNLSMNILSSSYLSASSVTSVAAVAAVADVVQYSTASRITNNFIF